MSPCCMSEMRCLEVGRCRSRQLFGGGEMCGSKELLEVGRWRDVEERSCLEGGRKGIFIGEGGGGMSKEFELGKIAG